MRPAASPATWRPVFEKFGADETVVARRFLGRVARLLGGDFGEPG
jgi:hypothetical protein